MNNKKIIIILMLTVVVIGSVLALMEIRGYDVEFPEEHKYKTFEQYEVQNGISESEVYSLKQDQYLLIYDNDSELSKKAMSNIFRILDYAKKNVIVEEVKTCNKISKGTTDIIICTEELGSINNIHEIFKYIKAGAGLMLAVRPVDDEIYSEYKDEMGIVKTGEFLDEMGIKLETNLLIGAEGFELEGDTISNSLLNIELRNDVKVHATTSKNTPLIWEADYELGKIVCVNGTFFSDRISRGVAINTIGIMQPNFIYPIINAGIVFIDDFPGPVPNLEMNELYSQLNLTVKQFYEEVWWPDMVQIGEKYGFKYTGVFIQNYMDNVVGPFMAEDQVVREELNRFGPELINQGGEIGYHGMNHQPYTYDPKQSEPEGYNAWKSEKDIVDAWTELDEYMKKSFPNYNFRTYVPPSNMLAAEVRKVFDKVAPNVKIISGLYITAGDEGVYEQEFEVAGDGIVELPRMSSGYTYDNLVKWNVYNGLTMHGIFSHFIHPDDILDKERSNGHDWKEMLQIYEQNLDDTIAKFSWINMMTGTEAGEQIKKTQMSKVYIEEVDNKINGYINEFREDMDFILRSSGKINNTINCDAKKIDDNTYFIHVTSPKFTIQIK